MYKHNYLLTDLHFVQLYICTSVQTLVTAKAMLLLVLLRVIKMICPNVGKSDRLPFAMQLMYKCAMNVCNAVT